MRVVTLGLLLLFGCNPLFGQGILLSDFESSEPVEPATPLPATLTATEALLAQLSPIIDVDSLLFATSTEKATRTTNDSTLITIYGAGIAKDAKAGDLFGAIGIAVATPELSATIMGNVIKESEMELLTEDYGLSVLTPAFPKGKGSSGMFDLRYKPLSFPSSLPWLHLNLQGSNQKWSITIDDETVSRSVANGGINVGLSFLLYSKDEVTLLADASYISRFLLGDLSLSAHESERETIFGTKRKTFHGFEIAFIGKYKGISLGISFPYLEGPPIDGLTRGRFVPGISFQSDITILKKLWGTDYAKAAQQEKERIEKEKEKKLQEALIDAVNRLKELEAQQKSPQL